MRQCAGLLSHCCRVNAALVTRASGGGSRADRLDETGGRELEVLSTSVNRMVGLWWLAKLLYPQAFPEDIRAIARDFHTLFYQVTPSEPQLDRILAGRG